MALNIIRPDASFREGDDWTQLERYLLDHWDRAQQARATQLEDKYAGWTKNYDAIPRETVRYVPWHKSSNVVVPLISLFVDTFAVRTQSIMMATYPLYSADGVPSKHRKALEFYLQKKALTHWKHYKLTNDLLFRGAKNGTVVSKQTWVRDATWRKVALDTESGNSETREVVRYEGTQSRVIPFDDFNVYPITANDLDEVVIKFNRTRYVEEEAKRLNATEFGIWQLSEEELINALEYPQDIKREEDQTNAGVNDPYLRVMNAVECYTKWEMEPSRYFDIVAVICPKINKLLDVYFYPYPEDIFRVYTPIPREDFFWGYSIPERLAQFQEEISQIHNDRRNNSFIASAPVFKRRSGSMVPDPSSSWYPGKVWDLEDMDDLEVVTIGRNISDLLAEENHIISLAERFIGIGALMQGNTQGMMGKRGVYNTGGVLAILSEGNQRQDKNIKDARYIMGEIAKDSFIQQREFGRGDDELIEAFPAEMQGQIREALGAVTTGQIRMSKFDVRSSNAAYNKETWRMSLLQMWQHMQAYGQQVMQLAPMVMNEQADPTIRFLAGKIIQMHQWMAESIMRAFDEQDAESIIPDVNEALAAAGRPGLPEGSTGPVQSPTPPSQPNGVVSGQSSLIDELSLLSGAGPLAGFAQGAPGEGNMAG